MKILGNYKEWTVTQTKLAEIFGVTVQRVNQLIDEEVVIRSEESNGSVLLVDSLRNFYISKNTSGDSVNYWREKALRERVNRQRDELKLQREAGEVYPAVEVEMAFAEMFAELRTNLLGMPAKFAPQLEGKSREEIYQLLTSEIENRLEELSNSFESASFDENEQESDEDVDNPPEKPKTNS